MHDPITPRYPEIINGFCARPHKQFWATVCSSHLLPAAAQRRPTSSMDLPKQILQRYSMVGRDAFSHELHWISRNTDSKYQSLRYNLLCVWVVSKMLTWKKYPQNVRRWQIVAEALRRIVQQTITLQQWPHANSWSRSQQESNYQTLGRCLDKTCPAHNDGHTGWTRR